MLQGFTQNKLDRLVSGVAYAPIEDLLTAAFFGGLAYMPPKWASILFKTLLQNAENSAQNFDWNGYDALSDIQLWPGRKIQPDVVVDLEFKNERKIRMVIEVKWNSDFSEDQALKQWNAFRESAYITDTFSLLLVRDKASAKRHVEDCGQKSSDWKKRVLILTWRSLAAQLESVSCSEATTLQIESMDLARLSAWVDDFLRLLKVHGENLFSGFMPNEDFLAWPNQTDEPVFYCVS